MLSAFPRLAIRRGGGRSGAAVLAVLGATSTTSEVPVLPTSAMVPMLPSDGPPSSEASTGLRLSVRRRVRGTEVLGEGATHGPAVATVRTP